MNAPANVVNLLKFKEFSLKIEDVIAFKRKRDRERDAGLDELARLTEELGGYDAPKGRK